MELTSALRPVCRHGGKCISGLEVFSGAKSVKCTTLLFALLGCAGGWGWGWGSSEAGVPGSGERDVRGPLGKVLSYWGGIGVTENCRGLGSSRTFLRKTLRPREFRVTCTFPGLNLLNSHSSRLFSATASSDLGERERQVRYVS